MAFTISHVSHSRHGRLLAAAKTDAGCRHRNTVPKATPYSNEPTCGSETASGGVTGLPPSPELPMPAPPAQPRLPPLLAAHLFPAQ